MHQSASGWSPVYVTQEAALGGGGGDEMADDDVELGVMSIGFMLPKEDDAVIWRGPRKNGLIKQFLTDVEWGALDYLLVDTPPGTSDEHISLVQYLAKALGPDDGALIVGDFKLLTVKMSSASWPGPHYPNASSVGNTLDRYNLDCTAPPHCLYNVASDMTEHDDVAASQRGR